MRIGLVIGKFYPPHEGHHSVIDRALAECHEVIVGVLWSKQESIDVDDRIDWLQDAHPSARVVAAQDEHAVDYDSNLAWANHMRVIKAVADWGSRYKVTHVYGSEKYILRLARELNAEPVIVDIARRKHPVSGTAIRQMPTSNWHHLRPATKAGLCKRIVCVGAESCGTTTLTRALARLNRGVWVPEYGRTYSEGMGHTAWTHEDLVHIAETQRSLEDQMARHSRYGALFCDTNTLATNVWEEFLVGSSRIAASPTDLYLLTDLCPWEDDGTRMLEDRREAMQDRFVQKLEAQSAPWVLVTGSPTERLDAACAAMLPIMKWDFAAPLG